MSARPVRPLQRFLFGANRQQQRALSAALVAASVYAVCIVSQWLWVLFGLVPAAHAFWLTSVMAFGELVFLAALRSGRTNHLIDPSLTLPQMVFAILCLCAAYVINPPVRALALTIAALVLAYGALTLTPKRCVQLGWFATAVFSAVMLVCALNRPDVYSPIVEFMSFLIAAATLPAIGHIAARLSQLRHDHRAQRSELQLALERVNLLATRDELTGLLNRRSLLEWMARELPRMRRRSSPLSIAMLDLDHFKSINDRFGHPTGDRALVNFAIEAQTVLREADALVRWGGEEFLLVLPDTPPELALLVIQRLHERVRDPLNWRRCPEAQVTFSAGLTAHESDESFEQTLARADVAVYEAKRGGRDRCVQMPEQQGAAS